MRFTPYDPLTNEELVSLVCLKEDVTDLELELMTRLETYMDAETDLDELVENETEELEETGT